MKTTFQSAGGVLLAAVLACGAPNDGPSLEDVARSPEKYEGKTVQIDHVLLSGDLTKGAVRYRLTLKSLGGTVFDAKFKPDGVAFVSEFDAGDKFKPLLKEGEFRAARLTFVIKAGGPKSKDKWLAHVTKVELIPGAPAAQVMGQSGKSAGANGGKPAEAGVATVTVVVEGVGKTADDALKDAFRSAVRQVVGAVVDAETLVKNDDLISDEVLTYSSGLVKKYDEVGKRQKDGLCHLKIRATVERTEVVAKLKAAKVTVKEVDGKALFAETVTELEREKDAKAILGKKFEGYPAKCISAEVTGKPRVAMKGDVECTLEYDIRLATDTPKYDAFIKELLPVLEKTAKLKGKIFTDWAEMKRPKEGHANWRYGEELGEQMLSGTGSSKPPFSLDTVMSRKTDGLKQPWRAGTFAERDLSDCMIVLVNTKRSKLHDRLTWSWYVVPKIQLPVARLVIDVSVTGDAEVTTNRFALGTPVANSDSRSLPESVTPGFYSGSLRTFGRDRIYYDPAVVISPYICWRDYSFLAPTCDVHLSSKVATEEIKKVTAIKCTVNPSESADPKPKK